ncbi:MAG: helicase-associated domain-containing protein [Deltaproteobacteria bacterium]|nr:helicase-associated domain-containing protein [Deltaproteobacteria bacterium]
MIVQSDGSLLLDVHDPDHEAARAALAPFAHLEKAPEHLHTYRITPVSLWNAAAAGFGVEEVRAALEDHARYGVPEVVLAEVESQIGRWGKLVLTRHEDGERFVLTLEDDLLRLAIEKYAVVAELLEPQDDGTYLLPQAGRGPLKQALAKLGYPVVDRAGYTDGEPLPLALRELHQGTDAPFALRDYQQDAAEAFLEGAGRGRGREGIGGGHGVVVLPCGAGKTVVGIGVLSRLRMQTLVLATGTTAVRQWISEILDKTDLTPEQVGEYSGEKKEIRPVTVATYQIATRKKHRELFERSSWGLVIYDEVHLLPAPLFRTTADLQARRRLGLTATLVREDGREAEVFGLIGPKRYELPWRSLEADGWVATATCTEVRVDPTKELLARTLVAEGQDRYRLAAEYEGKDRVVEALLAENPGERVLVIGQYLDQLQRLASRLSVPLITGATPQDERDVLFESFRAGETPVLVVSRVANFSVDLPDASVLLQVSGLFGSRQEEAQRLGRILRPKSDGRPARFYSVVTADTPDQDFALRRQRFLTEQGYHYEIERWEAPGTTARRVAG